METRTSNFQTCTKNNLNETIIYKFWNKKETRQIFKNEITLRLKTVNEHEYVEKECLKSDSRKEDDW